MLDEEYQKGRGFERLNHDASFPSLAIHYIYRSLIFNVSKQPMAYPGILFGGGVNKFS